MAENTEHIAELFSAYGPVSVRRMFSGAGIFAEGLMIAIAVDGVIYLKADTYSIGDFEREGLAPFRYRTRRGSRALTSYWRVPERLYDDPEELAVWAQRAFAAALRSGAGKRARSAKKPRRRV